VPRYIATPRLLTLSTVPIFAWPLDFFAHLLSFVFLYNSGTDELRAGFGASESRAYKVKSLLTVYLIVSVFEIVPAFAFDTTYHLGALWNFVLPVLLFVTPDKKNPKETVAVWIADSVFAQVSSVIDSIVPDAFVVSRCGEGSGLTTGFRPDDDVSRSGCSCAIAVSSRGVLADIRWVGVLGASGSYLAVYVFLFIATTHHLGKDFFSPSNSSSAFAAQMTIWHNLLAIWSWRYLISAVESLSIPGLISIRSWVTYHLPSYYLWVTAFFFLMLLTKKTASGGVSGVLGIMITLTVRKQIHGMSNGFLERLARIRRARAVSLVLALGPAGHQTLEAGASHPKRPSRARLYVHR